MIERVSNPMTGETWFSWKRKARGDVSFRRIVGGIGWPGKGQPGFLAVVGECKSANVEFPDQHDLHVVGEWGDWQGQSFLSVQSMFSAISGIQRVAMASEWWSVDRPEFIRDMRDHNRRQENMRRAPLRVHHPREDATAEWLTMRVHLRTSARKTMFFNHADRLRAAASSVGRDPSEFEWSDSPELTALLMAVAGIESRGFSGVPVRSPRVVADSLSGY